MNKATLALGALALLTLAACSRGNEDQLNEADLNATENLDELSNEAANVASEAEALETQAEQLNQEAATTPGSAETPEDENIQGM